MESFSENRFQNLLNLLLFLPSPPDVFALLRLEVISVCSPLDPKSPLSRNFPQLGTYADSMHCWNLRTISPNLPAVTQLLDIAKGYSYQSHINSHLQTLTSMNCPKESPLCYQRLGWLPPFVMNC